MAALEFGDGLRFQPVGDAGEMIWAPYALSRPLGGAVPR